MFDWLYLIGCLHWSQEAESAFVPMTPFPCAHFTGDKGSKRKNFLTEATHG